MAHVFLMDNQIDAGLQFMQRVQPIWQEVMPLLKGHNTWHLALFYLANRDAPPVLQLYKTTIWFEMCDTVLVQLDAISLLWRLDLAGLPQDELFRDVRNYFHQHPFEFYTGYNAVHYIYALARCGESRQIKKMLKQMRIYIDESPEGHLKEIWATLNLPFCQAMVAFVQQNYKQAYDLLTPLMDRCYQLGGSDAQCDIFFQTYLICLIKCNKQEAEGFYQRHLSHYHNTALEQYWF
jgi:hypothetical protein